MPPQGDSAIQNYSNLLGLQAQQAEIQQKQAAAVSAQQKAQYDTEATKQAFQLSQFIKNTQGSKDYYNDDGTPKDKLVRDATALAPLQQELIGHIISNVTEGAKARSALLSLSQDTRKAVGGIFAGLAGRSDLTESDVLDAAEAALETNKDPLFRRAMLSTLSQKPQNASSADLQKFAANMAATFQGESPVTAGTVDTGAAVQPVTANKLTGATAVTGQPIAKETPPANVVAPSGQIVHVGAGGRGLPGAGGSGGASSGSAMAPPPPNAPRSVQDAYSKTVGSLTERANATITAANNSPRALDPLSRAYDILDKPNGPSTGGDWLSTTKKAMLNTLSGLGIETDESADLNTLVKNLAQAEIARAESTGMNRSDMAQDLNAAASGHIAVDATSLKRIVRQTMATEMAVRAMGNAQQAAGGNPEKLAANEAAFRNIPRVIEGFEYGLIRRPEDAEAFLKSHNISTSEMRQIRKQIKAFQGG